MSRNLLLPAAAALAIAATTLGALAQSGPEATDKKLGFGILGARVAANGSLTKGYGATASERQAAGVYDVTFERDVDGCLLSVTGIAAFRVVTALNFGNNKVIRVGLETAAGVLTDTSFHLVVTCFE